VATTGSAVRLQHKKKFGFDVTLIGKNGFGRLHQRAQALFENVEHRGLHDGFKLPKDPPFAHNHHKRRAILHHNLKTIARSRGGCVSSDGGASSLSD
jgi:hypothetical protein